MLFSHYAALCLVFVEWTIRLKVADFGKGKIDMLIFLYVFCFKMMQMNFDME